MPLFIKAAAFESAELKIEPMSLGGVVRARTALFKVERLNSSSVAVLRLRHAQPEQRHVVRILRAYRTQLRTAQSHHAERSTEAAKQCS